MAKPSSSDLRQQRDRALQKRDWEAAKRLNERLRRRRMAASQMTTGRRTTVSSVSDVSDVPEVPQTAAQVCNAILDISFDLKQDLNKAFELKASLRTRFDLSQGNIDGRMHRLAQRARRKAEALDPAKAELCMRRFNGVRTGYFAVQSDVRVTPVRENMFAVAL